MLFTYIMDEIVNDYIERRYGKKTPTIRKGMMRFITNKLHYYTDSESDLYDPTFLGDGVNKLLNSFDNKQWDDLNEIEKKRMHAQSTKTPNTNIKCKKCGNESIFMYERQTRAADEATTQFYTCLSSACNNRWTI